MTSSRVMNLGRALAAAAIVLIVAAGVVLQPGADDASALVVYAGRFHILALHVPIGVLVLALAAEALTFTKRYRRTGDLVVGFALPLLVLTGVVAIVLGLALAHGGDYPRSLVAKHRNLTAAGVAVAALAMIAWPFRRRARRWGHRALLALAAVLMSAGAHFGGSLTHGTDYLFAPLDPKGKADAHPVDVTPDDAGASPPPADAGAADAAAPAEAGIDDAGSADASVRREASAPPPKPTSKQIAQSIFSRRCAPCHTTHSKGGLRLSTDPSKMKSVEVVAGDPGASRIYERLTLPLDDEYHMPPEKEAQLTKGEIAAIKQWIVDLGAR